MEKLTGTGGSFEKRNGRVLSEREVVLAVKQIRKERRKRSEGKPIISKETRELINRLEESYSKDEFSIHEIFARKRELFKERNGGKLLNDFETAEFTAKLLAEIRGLS